MASAGASGARVQRRRCAEFQREPAAGSATVSNATTRRRHPCEQLHARSSPVAPGRRPPRRRRTWARLPAARAAAAPPSRSRRPKTQSRSSGRRTTDEPSASISSRWPPQVRPAKTRSPTTTCPTSEPTASTTPAAMYPKPPIAGHGARTSFGPSSGVNSFRFSVPALTPLTMVRTRTWEGPMAGTSTSPTSRRPSSGAINTFIELGTSPRSACRSRCRDPGLPAGRSRRRGTSAAP